MPTRQEFDQVAREALYNVLEAFERLHAEDSDRGKEVRSAMRMNPVGTVRTVLMRALERVRSNLYME